MMHRRQATRSKNVTRILGTAGAVKNLEPLPEDAFFVQYGDGCLPVDYCNVMTYFLLDDAPGLMVG